MLHFKLYIALSSNQFIFNTLQSFRIKDHFILALSYPRHSHRLCLYDVPRKLLLCSDHGRFEGTRDGKFNWGYFDTSQGYQKRTFV